MFNSRSPQTGLWDCDHLYGEFDGKDTFYFSLASQRGKIFKGARSITLLPQEHLMQKARRHQKTKVFRESERQRQVVEHRIARLRQPGVGQSRYFGRVKTLFQLMMAATVANLTLVAASAAPGGSFFRLISAFCTLIVRTMRKCAYKFDCDAIVSKTDNFLSAPIILWVLRQQTSAYTCALGKRGFQPGG